MIHVSNIVSLFCGCVNCGGRVVYSYRQSQTQTQELFQKWWQEQCNLEETAQLEGGLHEVEVT